MINDFSNISKASTPSTQVIGKSQAALSSQICICNGMPPSPSFKGILKPVLSSSEQTPPFRDGGFQMRLRDYRRQVAAKSAGTHQKSAYHAEVHLPGEASHHKSSSSASNAHGSLSAREPRIGSPRDGKRRRMGEHAENRAVARWCHALQNRFESAEAARSFVDPDGLGVVPSRGSLSCLCSNLGLSTQDCGVLWTHFSTTDGKGIAASRLVEASSAVHIQVPQNFCCPGAPRAARGWVTDWLMEAHLNYGIVKNRPLSQPPLKQKSSNSEEGSSDNIDVHNNPGPWRQDVQGPRSLRIHAESAKKKKAESGTASRSRGRGSETAGEDGGVKLPQIQGATDVKLQEGAHSKQRGGSHGVQQNAHGNPTDESEKPGSSGSQNTRIVSDYPVGNRSASEEPGNRKTEERQASTGSQSARVQTKDGKSAGRVALAPVASGTADSSSASSKPKEVGKKAKGSTQPQKPKAPPPTFSAREKAAWERSIVHPHPSPTTDQHSPQPGTQAPDCMPLGITKATDHSNDSLPEAQIPEASCGDSAAAEGNDKAPVGEDASAVEPHESPTLDDEHCSLRSESSASITSSIPISVNLPLWNGTESPLGGDCLLIPPDAEKDVPPSIRQPAAPRCSCLSAEHMVVQWSLPEGAPAALTWRMRLREVVPGGHAEQQWKTVDLDAGRVPRNPLDENHWKCRAFLAQPGLSVIAYCILQGKKIGDPVGGTIVAVFPSFVVIDIDDDRVPAHRARQQIPHEWVLLAIDESEKDLSINEILDRQRAMKTQKTNRLRWLRAKNWVDETVHRNKRQRVLLWNSEIQPPAPGARVAVCGMHTKGFVDWPARVVSTGDGLDDCDTEFAPSLGVSKSFIGKPRSEIGWKLQSSLATGDDDKTWVNVELEPQPRTQVLPLSWIYRDCIDDVEFSDDEANRAAENLCSGQQILAHYNTAVQDANNDVDAERPEPRAENDITFTDGASMQDKETKSKVKTKKKKIDTAVKSERALRCEVVRKLVAPAEVKVVVDLTHENGIVQRKLPLPHISAILDQGTLARERKEGRRREIRDWSIRDEDGEEGSYLGVYAHQGSSGSDDRNDWDETIKLCVGERIRVYTKFPVASKSKKLFMAKLVSIEAATTHCEVLFDDKVAPRTGCVPACLVHTQLDNGSDGPRRLQQPQVVLEDLQIRSGNPVQVAVGFEHPWGVSWSQPSAPIELQLPVPTSPTGALTAPSNVSNSNGAQSPKLAGKGDSNETKVQRVMPPLPPYAVGNGVCDASVNLLTAICSTPLYFRLRIREAGRQEWKYVDGLDHQAHNKDTTYAWRSRIAPITVGQRVRAYGFLEGRKAPTPCCGEIISIGERTGYAVVSFESALESSSLALCSGASYSLQASHVEDALQQEIPLGWIEVLEFKDDTTAAAIGPVSKKRIQLGEIDAQPNGAKMYSIRVDNENTGLKCNGLWVMDSEATRIGARTFGVDVGVATINVSGLRAGCKYELSARARTVSGWSTWSPTAEFTMSRFELDQQELVEETKGQAFYKADLLPFAVFKEVENLQECLETSLGEEKFGQLQEFMGMNGEGRIEYDIHLSRWLVSMDGPIRNLDALSHAEVLLQIRDIISRQANPNHHDQATGRTPLTYACEYNRPEAVKLLLELGADVNSLNDAKESGLIIAACRGYLDCVEVLCSNGADVHLVSLHGATALSSCKVQRGMYPEQVELVGKCRAMLSENMVSWSDFEAAIRQGPQDDPDAVAKAVLHLANLDGSNPNQSDNLRLYEQLLLAQEESEALMEERGIFCANMLLLSQVKAAALPPRSKNCSTLAKYLLLKGIGKYCLKELHEVASSILQEIEVELKEEHKQLKSLPALTPSAQLYVGHASDWESYGGKPLHQWHAHGDVPWLEEQNGVGAYQALANTGVLSSPEDFCFMVGELHARLRAAIPPQEGELVAAFHELFPTVFWGYCYIWFLLGEADLVAPVFHEQMAKMTQDILGREAFRPAPNKKAKRICAKQAEYASDALFQEFEKLDDQVKKKTLDADALPIHFELVKMQSEVKTDQLCPGGLLDLVRGSIVCETEAEVEEIYRHALQLSVEKDGAEVVRVKNGFREPAVGGYSDLKLFVLIAKRLPDDTKICHICELQVHLQAFLDKKKFSHLPYTIDRGDFDA